MKLITWNVNGLTSLNTDLRLNMISDINADIVVLNETHHGPTDSVLVKEYKWFSHPRHKKHSNLNRYFGGVGVLVKESFLNEYKVSVIDKSHQDILVLLFENEMSEISFLVFSCYLAPENSPYGRNSSEFFGHMLSIIYQYNFVDTFFICGDFNSRLGGKLDYIESIDSCSPRQILDKTVNKHGECFLEFLKNANSIVANGRITPDFNDYTSVTVKGKSVVDYIALPIDSIEYCKKFEVIQASDQIEKLNLSSAISSQCKIPDHAILVLTYTFEMTPELNTINDQVRQTTGNVTISTQGSVQGQPNRKTYEFDTTNDFDTTPELLASTTSKKEFQLGSHDHPPKKIPF